MVDCKVPHHPHGLLHNLDRRRGAARRTGGSGGAHDFASPVPSKGGCLAATFSPGSPTMHCSVPEQDSRARFSKRFHRLLFLEADGQIRHPRRLLSPCTGTCATTRAVAPAWSKFYRGARKAAPDRTAGWAGRNPTQRPPARSLQRASATSTKVPADAFRRVPTDSSVLLSR